LEQWCHYLEGAKHPVQILMDHKNLKYFMTAQKLNRRQARWSLYLSRFDINLTHRRGKSSAKPDLLSRRSDHKEGVENDNDNVILLKPEFFTKNRAAAAFINPPLVKKIIDAQKDDEEWRTCKGMDGSEWKTAKFAGWDNGDDDTLLYKGKIYVPEPCRYEVVVSCHDTPVAGHLGQWRTLELIQRSFWWPGMAAYVGKFVKSCDQCQRTKPFPEKPQGELTPNEIPSRPWEVISTDLITQLPDSQGYDSILVVVDRFSKMTHVMPTMSLVTAEGVAQLF